MYRVFAVLMLLGLNLLAGSRAAVAAESYDNCTGFITSIPAVITTQGTWCLNQDLATGITSGSAIQIATNNVTVDCNNFKLGGLSAGPGTLASGIYAAARLNATVRNCNVRGFMYGVQMDDGGGHVIEDSRFDGNTFIGVMLQGDGNQVRRNRIADTGGSTVYVSASAIQVTGTADVMDNSISGVTSRQVGNTEAYGIEVYDNVGGRIKGNGIRGLVASGTSGAYGILMINGARTSVRDNDIMSTGVGTGFGISCTSNTHRTRDNVVLGFTLNISDCSNDSGNVVGF